MLLVIAANSSGSGGRSTKTKTPHGGSRAVFRGRAAIRPQEATFADLFFFVFVRAEGPKALLVFAGRRPAGLCACTRGLTA